MGSSEAGQTAGSILTTAQQLRLGWLDEKPTSPCSSTMRTLGSR